MFREDTFKILLTTDTHIGYLEKDIHRNEDSFNTWDEILSIARDEQVDFILHGGDLFHSNKPSRKTLFRTMKSLRHYCMGDKDIEFSILSDQSKNFPSTETVNYEDENYNVGIPIFVIHGNHDDPSGDGQFSALDILAVSNLVNYFGKATNYDDISIYPILLEKGKTKIALYGLGNVRDERLFNTFSKKKVKLLRPVQDRDDWFNIFTLHQNRVKHSKNTINEGMLDKFLDFIYWGHEHECRAEMEECPERGFYVYQSGSSVATSLSESESKRKHVGLLAVCGDQFSLQSISLKTVRPFMFDTIVLETENVDPDDPDQMEEFLAEKVEVMIDKSKAEYTDNSLLPLIRLRVEYTGYSTIQVTRFGRRFSEVVANSSDILHFFRKRKPLKKPGKRNMEVSNTVDMPIRPEQLDETRVEDFISQMLGPNSLNLLHQRDINFALKNFVDKEENSAFSDAIDNSLVEYQNYIETLDPRVTNTADTITDAILSRVIVREFSSSSDSMSVDDDDSLSIEIEIPSIVKKKETKKEKNRVTIPPKKKKLIKRGSKDSKKRKRDDLDDVAIPNKKMKLESDLLALIAAEDESPSIPSQPDTSKWGKKKKI
eukprot:TRINITY_DN1674_c0_g1_i11.p2 TRINITY_DN1674_c0_g1~~TRINITY_DN1674_c0_g1_i11.p2  ORF type:complete len:601 (-),score=141.20 TRINITY_DN1674_c0_g1_i11:1910-3712(-)